MNMKRILSIALSMAVSAFAAVPSGVKAENLGWILPFNGTTYISNGPYEGLHVNASAEAIDFAPNGCMTVRAPADGTVIDVLNVTDFGTVVRINQQNYGNSFFAHLDANNIYVHAGQTVNQGDAIALSGNSGTGGSGCHLHFEARTGVVAGNVYSGQSEPAREFPGIWWNTWYSPPPNFHHDAARFSGGAQNPENATQPSTMGSTGRHLANLESPPGRPAAHTSNISGTQVTLHGGGAPSTPGESNYATWFQFAEYVDGSGWQYPYGSYTNSPTFTRTEDSSNRCNPNGQHCHGILSWNNLRGWSAAARYVELWNGNSTQRTPHIAAKYAYEDATTVLEFYTAGADAYNVWQYHNEAYSALYSGKASSIRTERTVSAGDMYTVQAHYTADNTWSPWSLWLIVHW